MKTAAVVFKSAGKAAVEEIDMPPPGKHQVQVRSICSTISAGTEGWGFQDKFTWAKTPFPCVPGYERVGIVEAIGDDVQGIQVGQRVAATTGVWEGPVKPFWGSHIALANTWAGEIYALPEGVDDINASAMIVAEVGYNAAYRATMQAGDWVVVYGDGIIGQCAAQAARSRGAKVILVGHRKERLDLGAKHSADFAVNAKSEDVVERVRAIIGGKHVPVLLDTVQTEASQKQYIDLLEYAKGQIVYSGFTPGNAWADMALLQQRELTTHFIAGWTRPRNEATLRLMAIGKMDVRPLITHTVKGSQGNKMYDMILNKSEAFMGINLNWQEIR